MIKVLAFGAFDPITDEEKDFLKQAKDLGNHLTVIVAHDSAIRAHKHRDQQLSEEDRLQRIKDLNIADEVILGRKTALKYHILDEVDFDIIAMGYNQKPDDTTLRHELEKHGKYQAKIVRLKKAPTDPKT